MSDYIVFARKYRPQKLQDLVGQDNLVKTLQSAIEKNQLPHAFMLHGIRGIGKTTTARILAKGLNCLGFDGPTANPCGSCSSCVAIHHDRHLDVIEMDAASHTSVDDVREIIETAKYKAVQGRFKIYIIDEVHMLSKSAFNALLKTLEEPPPAVKFIFATTEIQKVPDTILSRCMRFDLKRMEPLLIQDYLLSIASKEDIVLDKDAAALIARAAEGSMRDALSLLDQAYALSRHEGIHGASVRSMLGFASRDKIFDVFHFLIDQKPKEILDLLKNLYQQGVDPVSMMREFSDILYDLICLKTVPSRQFDKSMTEFDKEQGLKIIDQLSVNALMQLWQVVQHHHDLVFKSHDPLQAFQILCLQLMYLASLPPLESLMETTTGSLEKKKSESLALGVEKTSEVLTPVEKKMTLDDLLTLCKDHKEMLLYAHLVNDIVFKSAQEKSLHFLAQSTTPKDFIQTMKNFLLKVTQKEWEIIVAYDEDDKSQTHAQYCVTQEKEKQEQAQNHPLVQRIIKECDGTLQDN